MNLTLRDTAAIVLAGVLLNGLAAGCSSSTPTTRYYLLSNPDSEITAEFQQDAACSVRLGSAVVAPYLQRTHIMLRSGANELVPAMQHRWSEPLEAGVNRLLSRCLGGGRQARYSANVRVLHMHGDTDGKVILQARWWLGGAHGKDSPIVMPEGSFSSAALQPKAGYDSLISTQRELVLQLCADIKAAVPSCS